MTPLYPRHFLLLAKPPSFCFINGPKTYDCARLVILHKTRRRPFATSVRLISLRYPAGLRFIIWPIQLTNGDLKQVLSRSHAVLGDDVQIIKRYQRIIV